MTTAKEPSLTYSVIDTNLQKWNFLSPNYTHVSSLVGQIYVQILGADAEFVLVAEGGSTPVREEAS